jgi:hypothetical protein
MRRKLFRITLNVIAVLLWISLCLAASPQAAGPSWAEHLDVVNVVIGFLFMALIGIIVWQVKKIDKNQGLLFDLLRDLSKSFYTLEGEHNAFKGTHGKKGSAERG